MKKIGFFIIILFCINSTFAQHESIERHFNSYKLNLIETNDYSFAGDTLTDNFHNYLPQQKISYNNLGFMSAGQPFIPAIYSQRPKDNVFWFLNNYYAYIHTHENILYFDARKPFTIFSFSGGGKGLENSRFLHTQNIGSSFNFALNYSIINSEGYYMMNKSKIHSLNLSAAYTKHKYQSHFNFIFNSINHNENGGIKSDEAFENSDARPENLEVNLRGANNKISQLGFQYNQEYKFGTYVTDTLYREKDTIINKIVKSKFSIMHDITLDRFYRIYTDNSTDFYQNYYIHPRETHDSTAMHYMDNKLMLNLNINSSGLINRFQILAGIKNITYYYAYNTGAKHFSSNYLTGIIRLETSKSSLNGGLNYGLTGREMFDLDAYAKYSQTISDFLGFDAYFNFELKTPNIFFSYYNSNNFIWYDTDFSKTNKTAAGIDFNFKKWKLNIGTNINLLHNYFVFDTLAMPQQISSANFIADIYIKKLFKLGNFYWFNQLSYQYISDRDNIPLPEFVAYTNLYFKKPIFNNVLTLQLGIDMKFHTNIYGYAYSPATGAFYLQNKKEFGSYPYAGAYASLKIKRFRGFVKASNFDSFFLPRDYYLLYKIPDNPFSFNFGISWEFYD